MSNDSGAETPRPRIISPQLPGTTELTELLGQMKVSLSTIGETFESLTEQSAKISSLGPTMGDVGPQIKALRNDIKKQGKKQDEQISEVKQSVRVGLKGQLIENLKTQIQEKMREEVAKQVTQEVDVQIREHLPVTLQQQSVDTKEQLKVVNRSLSNSKARRSNGRLCVTYPNEPLCTVLKEDSERSKLFPADLRSLFAYEEDMLKELLKDHGLRESEHRRDNLNKFMAHIGIEFRILPQDEFC